jgi:hypothetical protein
VLTRIDTKSVRGSNFIVTIPDIHRVEYAEGDKIVVVEIEGGMAAESGKVHWLIYGQTFSGWLPPYDSEVISADKRKEILENIGQSMSILGMPHKLVNR